MNSVVFIENLLLFLKCRIAYLIGQRQVCAGVQALAAFGKSKVRGA